MNPFQLISFNISGSSDYVTVPSTYDGLY